MDHEENITTLLSMGFENIDDIRKALRLSKNDINEAVSILTNEHSEYHLGTDDNMKDLSTSHVSNIAPPPYDSLCDSQGSQNLNKNEEAMESSEFPTTNLYELESRIFTDHWSIPYKKEESLGKCLISATKLAEEGLCEVHESCRRFIERCLPEAFKKLLVSAAVRSWGLDVQEGVRCMLHLLVNLVTARLKHDPVPETLCQVLERAFDPESEFHVKNKHKPASSVHWLDVFGPDQAFAVSRNSIEPYGWLIDLINKFGQQDGFTEIQRRFASDDITGLGMAALLAPLSKSAEFLNPSKVCPSLSSCMDIAVHYIKSLSDSEIKSKNVCSITDLLKSMKLLCLHLWPQQVALTNSLCLEVILRMLKCPHFNARMNGLKEVMKLIDDSSSIRSSKIAIDSESLLNWLAENEVLSIALDGNIDQVQYTDKIKGIVEFTGHRLSLDELSKIWYMQDGQNAQIVDNIHSIMTAASSKFSAEQFDHLLMLVQETWAKSNDQMRKRLILFIGRVGKETNQGRASTKIVDLLWDLAHSAFLSMNLVELALEEHFSILREVSHKDQIKKQYCVKCIEDIKKGTSVLPSLRLLHNICKNILKSGVYKQDRASLHELNKTHDIIKLMTVSLAKCHKQAVAAAGLSLKPSNLVDGRYTHEEYLVEHLSFLQFILQDGAQYLPWSRARDIWETLISNVDACEKDREVCFEWFTSCLQDLESDTQSMLFQYKLLKLEPSQLTYTGFKCFKTYFENVNAAEHKLKRSLSSLNIEKLELNGSDFLWQVALSSDENIANVAIEYLLEISYHALSPRLKKDVLSLHNRFINECYKKLECVSVSLGGTIMTAAVSNATKTLTAVSVFEVASSTAPKKSARFQNICRLLQVAESYISSIEENHPSPRTILPHVASFLGHPLLLKVSIEATKEEHLIVTHSNETLGSVKQRIAQYFHKSTAQIQLLQDENSFSRNKEQRLMSQLNFHDGQSIGVKWVGCGMTTTVTTQESRNSEYGSVSLISDAAYENAQSYLLEQEKVLPGVVMAAGGQVFEKLYQLSTLDDSNITSQVRNLLHLIPTDPAILDALDSISAKKIVEIPSPETPRESPRSSPKKFTVTSPTKERCESPKEVLKNLFDVSFPISPFKLLYNLEALSGKLMPVVQDANTIQSAQMFSKDFLSAGGLQLILNIFQKDSIPNDVDYDIRQGCYLTALAIARYLLCGETGLELTTLFAHCSGYSSTATRLSVIEFCTNTTLSDDYSSAVKRLNGVKAIETIKATELLSTLSSLLRVSWAAAAGNLHLVNCSLPTKEGTHSCMGRRSRQSSTGSNASSGSDNGEGALQGGVCAQQHYVKEKDVLLSLKAQEFLITCLQLRTDIFSKFSALPYISDFVIDVLLCSPSQSVRQCALEQFTKLSNISVSSLIKPRDFLIEILLKARLPLWVPSSCTRGDSQRLLSQCTEYFELGCRLLSGLTDLDQTNLHIDPKQMVEDEVSWLQGFSTSSDISLQAADSALLSGHFRLIKTLLTCDGVQKEYAGRVLIPDLLPNFLFPASLMISGGTNGSASRDFSPKCNSIESRIAAYEVLVELATGSSENLEKISQQLLSMHHNLKPELAKEYEYEPLVAARAPCEYVGIKNAGATCYMNSVIQQLYMQPGVREAILSVDENEPDEDGLFYQFQMVFGHLLESRLQYHTPENFWKCFRLWGEPINVREQQDAFEFFTHLIDQIDEYLIKNGWDPVFKPKYEGMFSDQKICQGCPHRYEREETFMALNLPVKSQNLIDSLDQFVKGELLEGHNAYLCEKCHEKRNTMKRTCIKSLPPVLVIQLKRFDYDWEANRSLKFDDYFKFPWKLDMQPYTAEGIQERETMHSESDSDDHVVPAIPSVQKIGSIMYELVGIVVHSGQANAGHYYSYVKERRLDSGEKLGKWFKFNDITVEEFDMNDTSLEAECFGGTYKAKVRDSSNSYPEIRQRYWNAYMLFYEKMEEVMKTPRTPRKTPNKFSFRKSDRDVPILNRTPSKQSPSRLSNPHKQKDSLSQLTQLVDRGERHGLFLDKIPGRIQQVVQDENLRFMHNRDIYNDSYFHFIQQLLFANMNLLETPDFANYAVNSLLPLSLNFLLNTYFRYKKRNSDTMNALGDFIEKIVHNCQEASIWFIDFFSTDVGLSYLKPFLLDCPCRDLRQVFARMLERGINGFFLNGGDVSSSNLHSIIIHLLEMLNHDVPDNCKSCSQYFWLLSAYAQMGHTTCNHLIQNNAFQKLLVFLLGPASANMQSMDTFPRRWTPMQTQEFGALHIIMASLILSCDLTSLRTCELDYFANRTSIWSASETFLPLPNEISDVLTGPGAPRYLQEVVSACREVSGSISVFSDMLVQCCFCNEIFSVSAVHQIMLQYSTVPSNELKNLSYLLLEILALEDPLQFRRVQLVIDGATHEPNSSFDGMLAIIRANVANDSRRSYQGVKFLVSISVKCCIVKEYLLQTPNKWQWAVNWLRKMMSEHSYWTPSNISVSNEDSNTKTFQRTVSAQDTLAEATALLDGLESQDVQDDSMDIDEDDPSKVVTNKDDANLNEKNLLRLMKRTQKMDDLDSIDT